MNSNQYKRQAPGQSPGAAIFGGTFDPVHFGHLRSAVEVRQVLGVDRVKLVPAGIPAHREAPGSSAGQRLAMLQLAVQGVDYLEIDEREIGRGGTSYMVDTLASLRAEAGPAQPLSLVLGADAFALLHEWHRWQDLLQLAHLVILGRPGAPKPADPAVAAIAAARGPVSRLGQAAAGAVCELQLTQMAISATQIRALIEAGEPIDYLLPRAVIDYIRQQGLYVP